jgi:hypothetical protein
MNGTDRQAAGINLQHARSALFSIDPGLPREDWHRVGRAAIAAGLSVADLEVWSSSAPDCQEAKLPLLHSHPRDLLAYHEALEERAAIYESGGGLPRAEAEMRARRDVRHLLPDFCEAGYRDDVAPSTSRKGASCQWPEAPR